jgi:hypothetical protein
MQEPAGPELGSRILARIREGMDVYDQRGDRLGTVERVYLGEASEEAIASGRGPATAPDPDWRDHSFVDDLVQAFAPDPVPEVVRARLLQHGFIRVDAAGIFAKDRYVTPDQIARVEPDGVHLRIGRDRLMAA